MHAPWGFSVHVGLVVASSAPSFLLGRHADLGKALLGWPITASMFALAVLVLHLEEAETFRARLRTSRARQPTAFLVLVDIPAHIEATAPNLCCHPNIATLERSLFGDMLRVSRLEKSRRLDVGTAGRGSPL
ncbi:hypothetical protein V8F20_004820 [Naviculisporaceae sp. PSN 640]